MQTTVIRFSNHTDSILIINLKCQRSNIHSDTIDTQGNTFGNPGVASETWGWCGICLLTECQRQRRLVKMEFHQRYFISHLRCSIAFVALATFNYVNRFGFLDCVHILAPQLPPPTYKQRDVGRSHRHWIYYNVWKSLNTNRTTHWKRLSLTNTHTHKKSAN